MIAAHQSHTRANFPMWRVRPRFDMALAACLIGVLVGAAACGEPPADDPLTAARCAVVGVLCTIAGTGEPARGALGIDARRSALYLPMDVGVALQSDGSAQIHVVDWNNHRVLRIDAAGRIVAFAGSGDPGGGVPGGAAEVAAIYHPTDVVFPIVDSDRAFIALWHDDAIGRIDADGQLSVACGGEIGFSVDGTVAVGAAVHLPSKLALHPDGRLCFSEAGSQRVRCIDAEGRLVTILGPTAGQSCVGAACDGVVLGPGFGGDGGPASGARLALPAGNSAVPAGGLAFSADGTLWLADALNHRVRRLGVDTAAGAAVVATIAGSGPAFGEGGVGDGAVGDGGPATAARLDHPSDVALGDDGSVYIADTEHDCVRRVDGAGVITTVAGHCGQRGDSGDGGPATQALLNRPYGIAVGPGPRLYIADTHNHRVRALTLP